VKRSAAANFTFHQFNNFFRQEPRNGVIDWLVVERIANAPESK